jgi:hypothetical protein
MPYNLHLNTTLPLPLLRAGAHRRHWSSSRSEGRCLRSGLSWWSDHWGQCAGREELTGFARGGRRRWEEESVWIPSGFSLCAVRTQILFTSWEDTDGMELSEDENHFTWNMLNLSY